ncbi:multidrug ABC transporter ATP-binding protein [Fictibacillus phosphorivorans]|uniref:Multidrug ABC transporter ATP-binding protein n=1 Tax=Fictibacillus phosphorivorans TaxID=1221500 RepID=A0A163SPL4_9BACL|nr:ABC transporter ATP-binding protein [Fictibacillus phosphorivorans]KZE69547.1 multidrug ABC transporter ATP-binding protein [Fictibacillus phosphorivorans]
MDTFKRLKDFYWPYKKFFYWSIITLFLVSGITVVYPMVLQFTIDEIIIKGEYSLVPYVAIGFIVLMAIKGAATYSHQFYGDLFGISSVYQLRESLYEKLQFLPFDYYDNAKTGDLMSRLTADVEGFRFFLSFGFSQLINFVLIIGFSLSVMFFYSIPLAIITLCMMPFLAIVVYKFDKEVHPAFRGIRKSMANLNTKVQENISGINTVKSLSREDFEIDKFDRSNEDYKSQFLTTSHIWARYFPIMELIGNLSVVLLLAYGGYLVIQGNLTAGELVAFFSLVWYIMGPIMNLGFIINTFSQSKASGERLLELLDEPLEMEGEDRELEMIRFDGEVVFEDVTHRYKNEKKDALKHVTFTAKPGQTIGLIGATGSGKTSITQLLSRFYQPQEGSILIDGKPLEMYSLRTIRKNIGTVLQESFLFSSTIKDNISYGNPDAEMDDIIDAAKRAQAHDFIMELPDGYDTVLGERGLGLSGGQKQRISIARAILIDPTILILDDATSAVDMETEFRIQKALKEVMSDRTTFIIAHRISSLKHADEILVLHEGEVIERGTHDELINNESGAYRRIYNIQYQDKDKVFHMNGRGV